MFFFARVCIKENKIIYRVVFYFIVVFFDVIVYEMVRKKNNFWHRK